MRWMNCLHSGTLPANGGPGRELREDRIQNGIEFVGGDSGPGWPGGTLDEMLLNTNKPDGAGIGLYVVKTAAPKSPSAAPPSAEPSSASLSPAQRQVEADRAFTTPRATSPAA